MANDFMYGVPPRHTHGENRVKSITLSYVIWLKNGRLSEFDENIGL